MMGGDGECAGREGEDGGLIDDVAWCVEAGEKSMIRSYWTVPGVVERLLFTSPVAVAWQRNGLLGSEQENDVKVRLRTVRCSGVVAAAAGDTTTSTARVASRLAVACGPRTRWIAR
jgi:hypothetical protein